MNRQPGKSAEQWHTRAAAKYQLALKALQVESRHLGLDGWQFPPRTYPMLDAAYDRAMDDLDAADDKRKDAADGLKREGPATHPD